MGNKSLGEMHTAAFDCLYLAFFSVVASCPNLSTSFLYRCKDSYFFNMCAIIMHFFYNLCFCLYKNAVSFFYLAKIQKLVGCE